MSAGDEAKDEAAIYEVLMKLGSAFRNLDAIGIDDLYVPDADWTNAFGTTVHGNLEIAEYLTVLFASSTSSDYATTIPNGTTKKAAGSGVKPSSPASGV